MDYHELSEKLGEALLRTPQYEGLRAAQSAMEQDIAAQILLQSMDEMKEEMAVMREQGEELPSDMMDKIHKLQGRMAENQALKDYNQAREVFLGLIKEVNDTLAGKTGVSLPQGCGGCPKKRS